MWFWFGLAVIALIAELLSGTFFFLLLCLGFIVAGLMAHMDFSLAWQLASASIFALLGLLVLIKVGFFKQDQATAVSANSNLNLDIGKHITISYWQNQRHTSVNYRGSTWKVVLDDSVTIGQPLSAGEYEIVHIKGIVLYVRPVTII